MVGWIIVIAMAVIMFFTADSVIYVVTWLMSYISAAFSIVGIRLEVFEYLDILYPYFRLTVQIIAIGIITVAVIHIVTSIKEVT